MKILHLAIIGILVIVGIFISQNIQTSKPQMDNHESPVNESATINMNYNSANIRASTEQNTYPANFTFVPPDPFPSTVPHQLVLFMKPNSTAKLYVRYTALPHTLNTGKRWEGIVVYNGTVQHPTHLKTGQITTSPYPVFVPISLGSNTTVIFTVTVHSEVNGVYWLGVSERCDLIPLAIGYNEEVDPSDVPMLNGHVSCPAQEADVSIFGISGGSAEYKVAKLLPGLLLPKS